MKNTFCNVCREGQTRSLPTVVGCFVTLLGLHWQVWHSDHVYRICRDNGLIVLQVNNLNENHAKMTSFHLIFMNCFDFHMITDDKNYCEGPGGPNSHGLTRICPQMTRRGHTIKSMIPCRIERSFAAHVQHISHERKNIGTWPTLNWMT